MRNSKVLEWDAGAYEELSGPMARWGEEFLRRLSFAGDEFVLDAGCGTGRVTEFLLDWLPGGSILAVDASAGMVEAAGERFSGEPRVRVERWDLLELEVERRVDVVFSTATFHWICDHPALFRRLAGVLKDGGRLAAQCGGEGNISRVRRATAEVMGRERFRGYFEGWEERKEYPGPGVTRARLEEAGFGRVEAWLHKEPTGFDSVEELARYLEAVILRGHLPRLPERERGLFAREVAVRIGEEGPLVIDYVRLNMEAIKQRETEGR